MSDDAIKNEVAEDISEEQVVETEEVSEELVEEEILDEEVETTEEETIEEGKHKDEDDDSEEEYESKKETVKVPKTKAGVIQAAVDMLKAAKKEQAQKMFSKMVLGDDEEASVKSADDAVKGVKKVEDPKAKAKVEAIDFDEDLENIIKEEATLPDGLRGKAQAICEAVLTSKVSQEIERLEGE